MLKNKIALIRFILNEKEIVTGLPPGMLLLDFIRYHQHLTGTKIGCREGDCGACTVLAGKIANDDLQYESMTSCLMPLGNAQGKHIVTIEGINFTDNLNPIQQAMADAGATQCGFCTPGFIVSLAGFCLNNCKDANFCVSAENAVAAIDGNICRCTGYKSIERAACKVAEMMKERNEEEATTFVAKKKILPEYFTGIKVRLQSLLTAELPACLPAGKAQDLPATRQGSLLKTHIVGGGTDLYVQKHDELANAEIRFVFDEPELNGITREGNKCIIGPSVTVTDLLNSPVIGEVFPNFRRYAKLVSSTPIRNMATVAGNFINASPIGDLTIFFLALDAHLSLTPNLPPLRGEGSSGVSGREIALRSFYTGYKQLDKKPEEFISKIWFEIPGKNSPKESLRTFFNFEKVSKRTHLDIASVNSAILITMNGEKFYNAAISAGGVGPVPLYLQKTSDFLIGKKVTEETINGAIEVMKTEISPISDTRGSKEYKTLLLGQLIKAHALCLPKGRT